MAQQHGHNEAHASHRIGDVAQWVRDLRECLIFLSRLPIARQDGHTGPPLALALRAFGFAGFIIGILAACVLGTALWLGFSSVLASLFAIATAAVVTGALHEDGLADVADGFGGGDTVERKLEIMRDSLIGAFGVLALVMVVAGRIFALASIVDKTTVFESMLVVVAVAALSRPFMGVMMHVLPSVRDDGRSADTGRPNRDTLNQLIVTSALAGVPLLWWVAGFWDTAIVLALTIAVFVAFMRLSRKQIGGQTGDVLGATQQVIEVVQLLTLAAMLG